VTAPAPRPEGWQAGGGPQAAPESGGARPRRGPWGIDIVAIGISTGGPQALAQMVPQLPADLAAPVVIVQHMPASFMAGLAASLDARSALHVVEGREGMPVCRGTVYLAPGDRQMKVAARAPGVVLSLTGDPPENHCRPSADYLFRSVAAVYGPRALGVVMTGMGADGREGLRQMRQQGARALAQDEASSVVYGMPMEVIKAGLVDAAVPLDQLAATIARIVSQGG